MPFEEFLEKLGVIHDGSFTDEDKGIVFVRVYDLSYFEVEDCAKELKIPWLKAIEMIGVLTDSGPYDKLGGGWVYFDLKQFEEWWFIMDCEEKIKKHIEKYVRLSDLAYDRGWFKEQEQYLCVVKALEELKDEL